MSRFESSRFARNSNVMNAEALKSACDTLGWKYAMKGNTLTISDANQKQNMYGEYVLQLNLTTNQVSYNTYYTPNAVQKVTELQNAFYKLNAEYARKSLIQSFKCKGFTYLSNDKFNPTEEEVYSFFMVGRSKDKNEDEPVAQIKFTILKDGTIVTDSDYLPNDVNEKAHAAMDELETLLGNERVMTKKEVPSKYLHKMQPRTTTIVEQKTTKYGRNF
jgi:hypothetical protein